MIVFAHTKFGLVRIQESEVKRGPPGLSEFFNPGQDRVKRAESNYSCCFKFIYCGYQALLMAGVSFISWAS